MADSGPQAVGDNGGSTDVGVTGDEIRLGNVSTLTGPVPGLFRGAVIGTQAAAAYQNSRGGVHGRRLLVTSADDRLDSGVNRAQHLELVDEVFAFVGSFSVNDDGGPSAMAEDGVPDIGVALSLNRKEMATHYSPQPFPPGYYSGPYNYYREKFGLPVVENTAFLISGLAAAREVARWHRQVIEAAGFVVTYSREVQPNEANFTADVVQMRSRGVRALVYLGDEGNMSRLSQAMAQQNYKPDLLNLSSSAYTNSFVESAGATTLEGMQVNSVVGMYLGDDQVTQPEVDLFNEWVARIDPRHDVDLFTFYGWLSMRLTVEALAAGPAQITREDLLSGLSAMGPWDANGSVAPVDIGSRGPADCFMVITVRDGVYHRDHPTSGWECGFGGYSPYRS